MVWALFPADPRTGEDKYFIFKKGTYKVGRKGCDVIINKDKGVSRIHSEIVVDEMISLTSMGTKSDQCSRVRIRDCSKYGTFINKILGSKEKVHELPNKETTLKDGDLVSFGTGNATYRFSFVPLVFFVYSKSCQVNNLLQDKVLSIGAHISLQLTEECTHVLVDHQTSVNNDVINALVAKKPVVLLSWAELVAEKSIGTEIPSYSSYIPTLTVDGVPVKVVDSISRANCLKGYTCLLESTDMYKFRDSFPSLLAMGGANVVYAEEFCSSSQAVDYGEISRIVCVVPQGSADKFGCFRKMSSLSRLNELDLLCAAISGYLDSSKLVLPTVLVSSSCSTDETIVADTDEEVETTSTHAAVGNCTEDAPKHVEKVEVPTVHPLTKLEDSYFVSSVENHVGKTPKMKLKDETTNSDIIYSQDLIIRDWTSPAAINSCDKVLNFKCFKKKNTESGNSFNNLIPFAKYPYKDSDYENPEMIDSVKEEKKRKQMEAVAEDLFNYEKGRRRGVAGSLRALLSHG